MQSRRRQLRNSSVHFRNYGTHVNMLGAGFSCSPAQVLANLTIFHDYKQIIIGRSVSELAARKTTVQTLKVGGWLSTLLLLWFSKPPTPSPVKKLLGLCTNPLSGSIPHSLLQLFKWLMCYPYKSWTSFSALYRVRLAGWFLVMWLTCVNQNH